MNKNNNNNNNLFSIENRLNGMTMSMSVYRNIQVYKE